MPRIRTFVAVELAADVRRNAEALQKALAADGVTAKWVDADSLHLTLAFLGDIGDTDIPAVCGACAEAAKKVGPFTVQIAGVGAFPNLRRPKICWAGLTEGAEELIALHDAVADRLENTRLYNREDRGYRPHLTLGRVKAEEDSQTLATAIGKHANWVGGRVAVERVTVFSSEFRRGSPEYSILGRAELRGKVKKPKAASDDGDDH
jgi:RNA 2',3'-cyclic 3'-phosphodiesterase